MNIFPINCKKYSTNADSKTLAENVEYCDISKFSNTDTNVQHVKTCQKSQKVPNYKKKRTSDHVFLFSCHHHKYK